jgi:membrane associated rhomboid family serine protease
VQFGPGPITPAVRALIIANVSLFVATLFTGRWLIDLFGLTPVDVFTARRVWQPVTYLFLHSPSGFTHILFNMLAVWMFGVDLERRWGTAFFLKFYFTTGVGAAASVLALSLVPLPWTAPLWQATTIGASGAVYGLLMAWALLFPHRQILFMFIFPLPARVFVLIIGGIALLSAIAASGGPVANLAHLGGLVIGWLYLKGPTDLRLTWRYHLTRWRMERMRRRFDVHRGGKDDGPWVH